MAKNWKVAEAVKAIQAGNKEDILDIGRRFPLFTVAAAQINTPAITILECLPDYCTARKIESMLKGDIQENDDEDAGDTSEPDEAEEKAEKKTDKKKEAAKSNEEVLEDKTAKELFQMCKAAKIEVEPKQDKKVYIKALKDAAKKADKKKADDDWDDDADEKPADKKKASDKKKEKKTETSDDDWDL